jgi:hypothetical protein
MTGFETVFLSMGTALAGSLISGDVLALVFFMATYNRTDPAEWWPLWFLYVVFTLMVRLSKKVRK